MKKATFTGSKQDVQPKPVVIQIFNKLRDKYDVFIDQTMIIGGGRVKLKVNLKNQMICFTL